MDADRLIFLDEIGARIDMTRRYGRIQRGIRLVEAIPAGHWKTTTLIGALRVNGVPNSMVIDGPTNTDVIRAFVEQRLFRNAIWEM